MIFALIFVAIFIILVVFMLKRKKNQKVCDACGEKYTFESVKSLSVIRCAPAVTDDYYDIRTIVICPKCKKERTMNITVPCNKNATEYELKKAIERWFNS